MSRRASLPGLPRAIRTGTPALDRWIELVTERLEVREGNRGNPDERAVTVGELADLGASSGLSGLRVLAEGASVVTQAGSAGTTFNVALFNVPHDGGYLTVMGTAWLSMVTDAAVTHWAVTATLVMGSTQMLLGTVYVPRLGGTSGSTALPFLRRVLLPVNRHNVVLNLVIQGKDATDANVATTSGGSSSGVRVSALALAG